MRDVGYIAVSREVENDLGIEREISFGIKYRLYSDQ
jgi:hypothetical protein